MPQVNVGSFNPSTDQLDRINAALDYFFPPLQGESSINRFRRYIKARTAETVNQYERHIAPVVDATILPD